MKTKVSEKRGAAYRRHIVIDGSRADNTPAAGTTKKQQHMEGIGKKTISLLPGCLHHRTSQEVSLLPAAGEKESGKAITKRKHGTKTTPVA